ncbi:MAG: T9SS type A sorting domain-containing protein [Ignavibacteriaceae bacterium]|nr:T9SS type A sorting domain-containing protein [Ignavibacteriaceae bacterium]
MRSLTLFFVTVVFFLNNITAQINVNDYLVTSNGFTFNVQFQNQPYTINGENRNVINFQNSIDESAPGSPILPSKTIFIAIPPFSKIKLHFQNEKLNLIKNVFLKGNPVVKLQTDSSITYMDTEIQTAYLSKTTYPEPRFKIEGYSWVGDYYCAIIKIFTHQYDWSHRNVFELLEAQINVEVFDKKPYRLNNSPISDYNKALSKLIINYQHAQDFRSFRVFKEQNDFSKDWIDYSKEYVKLAVPADGIYRITYEDLQQYGLNTQIINPNTIKIFLKGEELPLYISGESDNSFDQNDFIEFWCKKNYGSTEYRKLVGQGEDYLPFLDIYSDTSIIWLTWDGENGSRISEVNQFISGLNDSITSHLVKLHLEKDALFWYYGFEIPRIQLPFWHENKTWIWLQVTNSGTTSFPFGASSIVPNTNVTTLSRLNSWYSDGVVYNAHKYGARLNSTQIQDSVVFSFETIANLKAEFNSNDLIDGTKNYRIAGMQNEAGKSHKAVVDWVDIEYFQHTVAQNDSLLITIPDSVLSAVRVVKISSVAADSASLIIYKIGGHAQKINSFQLNENTVTFTDTISGGDQYFIVKNTFIKKPSFLYKKKFLNLRSIDKQADYILISNYGLSIGADQYASFIENSYNLNVEKVFVQDLYDEFSFGYLRPESIKEFLIFAYDHWQFPKPSYLLLLGDCTYDYKNLFTNVPNPRKEILVPSFGNPVSDSWYTMWDTTNLNIQQMFVGRIPANSNEEVLRYLDKHSKYIFRNYDDWNKKFLLFSGGYPTNLSQMEQIKQTNEKVFTQIIQPPPIGGRAMHFYKTNNPATNLGPYSAEQIREALNNGGLFISYVGHSGTRTWDNGITEPSDIKNAYDDRYPIVTDNGCSTGKFAEPDIDSFGELFVVQDAKGQAINYLGNSSLGYTSTGFRMPELFYKRLMVDSAECIGEAHFLAKMDNFIQSGINDVNKLYNYCSVLFGDPLIKVSTPEKPNFVLGNNAITILNEFITNNSDSLELKLIINNWGKVINDSLAVELVTSLPDSIIFSNRLMINSPFYSDTLEIKIPLKGYTGEHTLSMQLDPDNSIDEIYETDNSAEIKFIVYSTKIRPIEVETFYNSTRNSLTVLNPTNHSAEQGSQLEFAVASKNDFSNQTLFLKDFDSLKTTLPITNLQPRTRYYWRAKLKNGAEDWSPTVSFFNTESPNNYSWFMGSSFNLNDIKLNKVEFDSVMNGWRLKKGNNNLKIGSAGFSDGKYASIQYNFLEYVSNTFFRGFATALIDSFDLHPYNLRTFEYPVTPSRDSLISYLNSLETGSILAVAATDEVSEFFNGAVGDSLKRKLRGFGSVYVDSIRWRDSWALIGIKGAAKGTVPEVFSKSLTGPAIIDTFKFVQFSNGQIEFPVCRNSIKWLNVFKKDSIPNGAAINYFPLGHTETGNIDTLSSLTFEADEASISNIDSRIYKQISIMAELKANDASESPQINEVAVNYNSPAELGINYQVVSLDDDSINQGDNAELHYYLYNVGKSAADSFKVMVEVIKNDNSKEKIYESEILSIGGGQRQLFNLTYNTSNCTGNCAFYITIDSENRINELFEDNNIYSIPFFVKADTTKPVLTVLFNGSEIMDGDYVEAKPTIKMELSDQSNLPIADTSSISIFLNNIPVYFAQNSNILTFQINTSNPKLVVEYKPTLQEGENNLKVLANDGYGNQFDSLGFQKRFLVSNEAKLLYTYNYPNPANAHTYFTFRLTQIPEQIKIMIYTVSGRLVKEIIKKGTELTTDFNKIFWDTRDEDGDLLGNGTYLYKVIMSDGNKTETTTQKLAIVR